MIVTLRILPRVPEAAEERQHMHRPNPWGLNPLTQLVFVVLIKGKLILQVMAWMHVRHLFVLEDAVWRTDADISSYLRNDLDSGPETCGHALVTLMSFLNTFV